LAVDRSGDSLVAGGERSCSVSSRLRTLEPREGADPVTNRWSRQYASTATIWRPTVSWPSSSGVRSWRSRERMVVKISVPPEIS